MELDTLWWDKRAQHAGDHSVQSMQEQECEFGDNIPAAVRILCHEEEGSYLPSCFILQPPSETDLAVACSRG
jgi:hypothetical protein